MLRQHRTDTTHRRTAAAVLAAAALGVSLLAGCSGSGSTSGSTSLSSAGAIGGSAPAPARGEVAGQGAKAADAGAGTTTLVTQAESQRKLTRQAQLSVTVKKVDTAAAQIRSIAAAANGLVLNESLDTQSGPDVQGFSTITISVPSAALDATLDRIASIGTVLSRSTSTDDVTSTYVDTQSRLETMRASVDRVRALMSKATKIGDVVAIESELSRREADLESLQAQLAALDTAVSMSPVTVRLATAESALAQGPSGFLGGLKAGWDAFTASVVVLLTALGAVLPFAVAAAVVLVPLAVWLRRRRPQPQPVPPAPPAAA